MKFLLIYWLLAPGGLVPATGTAVFDDQNSCESAVNTLVRDWPVDYSGRRPGRCVPISAATQITTPVTPVTPTTPVVTTPKPTTPTTPSTGTTNTATPGLTGGTPTSPPANPSDGRPSPATPSDS